jgi:alpha-beta hydrolase superfamily lysophospholipase
MVNYASCSGCQIHLGFSTAYKTVAPLVKNAIDIILPLHRGAKFIGTGHSLGGAMAAFYALDMK